MTSKGCCLWIEVGRKLDAAGRSQPSIPGVDLTQHLLRAGRVAARECIFDLCQPGSDFLVDACTAFLEFPRVTVALTEQALESATEGRGVRELMPCTRVSLCEQVEYTPFVE